jgi:hypothetical protein
VLFVGGFVAPGFGVFGLAPGFGLFGVAFGFGLFGFEFGLALFGFAFGFGVPGFVEPEVFGDAPGFDCDPGVGLVFGVVPGVVLFGFVVGGCVAPGVFWLFGFDGVAPVGGAVMLPVGGRPVLPVGRADGDVWPGVAPLEGADPPPGAACPMAQVPQARSTERNVIFPSDMNDASNRKSLALFQRAE